MCPGGDQPLGEPTDIPVRRLEIRIPLQSGGGLSPRVIRRAVDLNNPILATNSRVNTIQRRFDPTDIRTVFGIRPAGWHRGGRLPGCHLLDDHPIAAAAAEHLRRVHLLRLGRRNDERTRRCRTGDVGVVVDTFPQQGGEGLGALVAHVLVLIPGPPPPPAIAIVGAARVLGDAA